MMEVEYGHLDSLSAPTVLAAILNECSAVTDYRTLRDTLPRRLANLLKCRCVLLYQRIGETLQFASGTFDDKPGWSPSLLAVAHINPIDLNSDTPEASAWRSRSAVVAPGSSPTPTLVAVPLLYRQRAVGVLVAIRGGSQQQTATDRLQHASENRADPFASSYTMDNQPGYWSGNDVQVLEAVAGIVALLLENTRLLERDRERIHELSLLNSISSQMNCSMYEWERIQNIIIQRTREITGADLCSCIIPSRADAQSDGKAGTQQAEVPQVSWLPPSLGEMLFQRLNGQREGGPLVIERPGDLHTSEYLNYLAPSIKTFFAIPLLSSRMGSRVGTSLLGHATERGAQVLGIIVGAYHRPWKLRREELVLLQVLASQASAVLENMQLMNEVVEARNQARTLLRQVLNDQRLKALILESIPSGLITVDLHGNITTFNRAAEDVLGYHPSEVLGKPLRSVLNVDSLQKVMKITGEDVMQYRGDTYSFNTISETLTTVDRQGQEIVLDIDMLPLRNDRGEQIGALATFSDVTSVHRLEEEKRRLDRLASLGEMAASVAHEVRNPLASIKTSVQMLMDDLTKDAGQLVGNDESGWTSEETQESVSIVLKEVERLDSIVRDLLLFAKPRQLHRVPCNIMELSDHILRVMQTQCAEAGVEIHRVYHPVPLVLGDMAQIEQVLFNLYMNAVQAMPDGGVLTVSCQVIPESQVSPLIQPGNGARSCLASPSLADQKPHPAMHISSLGTRNVKQGLATPIEFGAPIGFYSTQQTWLEISVSDTGSGISPGLLERIFQPFFTTKAHGIGLGLPITRRLIEDHRGYMLVESQLGYGATFSVCLPLNGLEESPRESLSIEQGGRRE